MLENWKSVCERMWLIPHSVLILLIFNITIVTFIYLFFQLKGGEGLTSMIELRSWAPWSPKPMTCKFLIIWANKWFNLILARCGFCKTVLFGDIHWKTLHRLQHLVFRDVRWNKGTILRASVDYIKRMQKDIQRTREVENNFRRMEMANKQLWLRIQVNIHSAFTWQPLSQNKT